MLDQWIREGKGFMLVRPISICGLCFIHRLILVRDSVMRLAQVYSITSATSFDDARLLYDKVLRGKDADRVPVVLVGNKCDLESERAVTLGLLFVSFLATRLTVE